MSVGIQLSEDNLSLMLLDNSTSQPVIDHYVDCPIHNDEPLASQTADIRQLIDDRKLASANTSLVLDDNDYHLLSIEAPPVTADEMSEAVKWKVKDLLAFPLDEAIIDVFLQADGQVESQFIANVVAVKKHLIDEKTDSVTSLGLNLTSIDIPELAYRNYIENSVATSKNMGVVLLKKGFGRLTVIKNDAVYFSRSFSINYKGGLFDDLPENDIVLELQRSLDYYERQLKQSMPAEILVVGENIVEEKITAITKDSLNQTVTVDIGKEPAFAEYDFSEEHYLHSSHIITTYGAALRHRVAHHSSVGVQR